MTKNQFSKHTTTFAILGGLGLISLTGVISVSAHGIMGNPNKNPEVQKALIAKDLNAYKQAVLTNNSKNTQERLDTLTQDKLNLMSDNYTKMQAIQTKITESIKAGNKLNDYKLALKETKTLRDSIHTAMEASERTNSNKLNRTPRSEPTDTQIETRYNEQVAQYKKDGTLPTMGKRGGDRFDGEAYKGGRGNHDRRGR